MKSLLKKSFVAIGAVACLGSQIAYSATDPNTTSFVGNIAMFDGKSQTGPDGNIRVLWDLNPGVGTYSGSTLFILDNKANFLAAGTPNIPASVGFDPTLLKSRILVQPQKDGNTTLLFLFNFTGLAAPQTATALGVWTYNSAGKLIASATYGPFVGTVIQDVRLSATGNFTVVWTSQSAGVTYGGATGTVLAWTLNEFGGVVATVGPFGPFAGTFLGKVDLDQNSLQHWYWQSTSASGTTVAIWNFNASGTFTSSGSFGPF